VLLALSAVLAQMSAGQLLQMAAFVLGGSVGPAQGPVLLREAG
jgi:hypothetical protein